MVNEEAKTRILSIGAEIIHIRGYNNTSINDICIAAKMPKGSFYYYFGSKEDFATELIDFYYSFMFSIQEKYLNMDQLTYLERLRGYYQEFRYYFISKNCSGGCPIGNLAQELSDSNDTIREKLRVTLEKTKNNIATFLRLAQENGEISKRLDPEEFADFIFNSWEGSLLRMKVTKSIAPMELFEKSIFEMLLNNFRNIDSAAET